MPNRRALNSRCKKQIDADRCRSEVLLRLGFTVSQHPTALEGPKTVHSSPRAHHKPITSRLPKGTLPKGTLSNAGEVKNVGFRWNLVARFGLTTWYILGLILMSMYVCHYMSMFLNHKKTTLHNVVSMVLGPFLMSSVVETCWNTEICLWRLGMFWLKSFAW